MGEQIQEFHLASAKVLAREYDFFKESLRNENPK